MHKRILLLTFLLTIIFPLRLIIAAENNSQQEKVTPGAVAESEQERDKSEEQSGGEIDERGDLILVDVEDNPEEPSTRFIPSREISPDSTGQDFPVGI